VQLAVVGEYTRESALSRGRKHSRFTR